MVPGDGMRSNGHKLKHKNSQLNVRKNFIMLRVAELEQVAQGDGVSLSADIPNPSKHVSVLPVLGHPALAVGLDRVISRGPFQP